MNILEQEEALHQALGDPPPFALCPCPCTGKHRQRLVIESEGGLPPYLGSRRGCHIGSNLGSWSRTTSRLLDRDLARYPERDPRGSITWNLWWLFGNALPFSGMASRRRRNLIPSLGLLWLSRRAGTGQKLVNGYCTLGHHLFTLTGLCFQGINLLGCCWLGYLNRSFGLSNGYVDFKALRYKISRDVPYWYKRLRTSKPGAEVPNFANS